MPNNNNKYKALQLVRWYPNRYDPMPGLFIQRHIEAVNQYCNTGVVYTHMIQAKKSSAKKYDLDYQIIKDVPTACIYYRSSNNWILPIRKIINIWRFFRANKLGVNKIESVIGKPDVIHVHILTRLGIIAYYYNIFQNTPFIITEHWSRYLELTGTFKGRFRKFVTRLIVGKASSVTAVTNNLATAMKSHGLLNANYFILPNVVDDVFTSSSKFASVISDKKTFLHVSCFEDKSKNISGLIRMIKSLSDQRNDFVFRMVGDGMDFDAMKSLSHKLGMKDDVIQFTGLLEGEKLVEEMRKADILVIFSNYENMPVVINESLSMGVPVIATRVGGIPEVVNDSNGILVDAGNEKELLQAAIDFIDGNISFKMENIQKNAINEFLSESIGQTIFDIYDRAIKIK